MRNGERSEITGSLVWSPWPLTPPARDKYDLVIANGLFGFGTDSGEANAAVIDACHAVLKPGGRLLLGYSHPGTFDPGLVDLERFRPARISGLDVDRYLTQNENRHTFACFTKVGQVVTTLGTRPIAT